MIEKQNAILAGSSLVGMCVSITLFLSSSYYLHVEQTQYQIQQGYVYLVMAFCCLLASSVAFALAVLNKSGRTRYAACIVITVLCIVGIVVNMWYIYQYFSKTWRRKNQHSQLFNGISIFFQTWILWIMIINSVCHLGVRL